VDIPAGVASNNYLTLRGQGAVGPRNGPSGDLLVMLDIKEDDRFERQGDDLYHDFCSRSPRRRWADVHRPDALRRRERSRSRRHPDRDPARLRGGVCPVLGRTARAIC
jgi:hypothetical protein